MRSAMALLAPAIVNQLQARIGQINPVKRVGYVSEIIVSTVRAILPDVVQGELCEIETSGGHKILGEVVAFSENIVTISCLESVAGVALGSRCVYRHIDCRISKGPGKVCFVGCGFVNASCPRAA